MKKRALTRKEKALFVIPILCFMPLAFRPLAKDLLSKNAEQLSALQAIDCGSDPYNSAYSHQPTSDEANSCMAEGIKSGRGFRWRQEKQAPVPRFYTGEYKAMAIVCVADNSKARWSKIGYWQLAHILNYHCSYKFGIRFNERVSIDNQSECAISGTNRVACGSR